VRTHEELNSLLRTHSGLLARRHHPELAGSFDWLLREGRLTLVLRAARIKGWQANLAVHLDGRVFYIDIAFKRQKLAIEIDGRLHETDPDLFESERWRQNALVAEGWRVLRFTWTMLRDHPDAFIEAVLDALH
jgi:very-short-patch-repair endonuclease